MDARAVRAEQDGDDVASTSGLHGHGNLSHRVPGYLHASAMLFYDDAGGSDGGHARRRRAAAGPVALGPALLLWRATIPALPRIASSTALDTATVPRPTPTMPHVRQPEDPVALGVREAARRATLRASLYQPRARLVRSGIRGATAGLIPGGLAQHIKGLLRVEGVAVVQLP